MPTSTKKKVTQAHIESFVKAVTSMALANTDSERHRIFRKASLKLHPNRHGLATTDLFQKLGHAKTILNDRPTPAKLRQMRNVQFARQFANSTRLSNVLNNSNSNSSSNTNNNANWTPKTSWKSSSRSAKAWSTGRKYRQGSAYVPKDKFKTSRASSSENYMYDRMKRTNPVEFKRKVLDKIPRASRPIPPGPAMRARLNPKQKAQALKEWRILGTPVFWVATDYGRREVALAVLSLEDKLRKRLLAASLALGLDLKKIILKM